MRVIPIIFVVLFSVASCRFEDPDERKPGKQDREMFVRDSTLLYSLKEEVKELQRSIEETDSILSETIWPAWSEERYDDKGQYLDLFEKNVLGDSLESIELKIVSRQHLKTRGADQYIAILSPSDSITGLMFGDNFIVPVDRHTGKTATLEYKMIRSGLKGRFYALPANTAPVILQFIEEGVTPMASLSEVIVELSVDDPFVSNLNRLVRKEQTTKTIEEKKEKMEFIKEKWIGRLN